jgi:hypothetical protein
MIRRDPAEKEVEEEEAQGLKCAGGDMAGAKEAS